MAIFTVKHKFVEYIPEKLDAATIYICLTYATAIHECCCGCGNKVVTPLDANNWRLIDSKETISLEPSILNTFSCESHYYIKNNNIEWIS